MIEREQRVCLPTAKVCLQIDDRITSAAVQALQRSGQQLPQPVRQECPLKEVARDTILVGAYPLMYLRQVSGELGQLIAARGNVGLWRHNLAPGTQAHGRLALDRRDRNLARLIACLFLEAYAQQFLFLPFNLAGLLSSRDGSEQSLDAIQSAVGIIGTECLLVRPLVASCP